MDSAYRDLSESNPRKTEERLAPMVAAISFFLLVVVTFVFLKTLTIVTNERCRRHPHHFSRPRLRRHCGRFNRAIRYPV